MKRKEVWIIAAILCLEVMQMGANGISPIIAELVTAFPQAGTSAVQFLMTFPSLIVIPVSLLAGKLAERVPKKYLTALGSALFCASGLLSLAFHGSLPVLYAWAVLMGAGIGLVIPIANSLITDCVSPERQDSVMGWLSSASSVGAMLMTFFGGLLAEIHWSLNYLVYLVALPGLILSLLCLPKDTGRQQVTAGETPTGQEKPQYGPLAFCCVLGLMTTMLYNTFPVNMSLYLAEKGIGTAAQSGTATTLLLLVGVVGGILYGRVVSRVGRYVYVIGFALMTAGQVVCGTAAGLWQVYLGCVIGGASLGFVMARVLTDAGASSGSKVAFGMALITVCANLGGFCAPVLTAAARLISGSEAVGPRFLLSAACAAVMAVVMSLVVRRDNSGTGRFDQ
ncbi:MAG: MFS transporter [Oscillospiraceae bacterium]|nr:MFS transporter [Oscillospiraceae bacterium]